MSGLPRIVRDDARHITATSRDVADFFDKRHDRVLRAITNLIGKIDSHPERSTWFTRSSYINEQNKPQPMFQITLEGLALLVLGFTGAGAMRFKLACVSDLTAAPQQSNDRRRAEILGLMAQVAAKRAKDQP